MLRAELVAATQRWAVDRVVSALGHDLAQPLASVANYTNACVRLLQSGGASREELLDAMQQAAAEALRANEIVRREWSGGELHRQPVSLNALVREVLAAEQSDIAALQIAVSLRLDDKLADVNVDPAQIQVVLWNLIINALEAMAANPPDSRQLSIETWCEGEKQRVRVVDSGPAVDTAILARMFDLYFTTKPRRAGLGLSVCRALVKAHGGSLLAEPNGKSGLSIEFSFPVSVE